MYDFYSVLEVNDLTKNVKHLNRKHCTIELEKNIVVVCLSNQFKTHVFEFLSKF
jgi:hypothetical protein